MSFNRMRLIPEFTYDKLNQSQRPRQVDFGDDTNGRILDMTTDISPVLKDSSKPIEERIRIFYQHILRKLTLQKNEVVPPARAVESSAPANEKKQKDVVDAETTEMGPAVDLVPKEISSRDVATAQRKEAILGRINHQVCSSFINHSLLDRPLIIETAKRAQKEGEIPKTRKE